MTKAILHHMGGSVSFGRLSLEAKVLWTMLLTSADDQGRGSAEADVVKWQVCPNVPELTPDNIPAALNEMAQQDMLHLYQYGRRHLFQILRWWDYQQLQWAQPSRYRPPPGWTDRIRVQRGHKHVSHNWDTPGGFLGVNPPSPDSEPPGSPSESAPRSPPLCPPDGSPDALPENPPGPPLGRPGGAENNTKPSQINPIQSARGSSPLGDAWAEPTTTPESPRTGSRRGQDRPPPAVLAFRRATHRYPPKSWYADLDEAVGREEPDLQFWYDVVKAWVGLGWNPSNVVGMLDLFNRRQLPGQDEQGKPRSPKDPLDPLADFQAWLRENTP